MWTVQNELMHDLHEWKDWTWCVWRVDINFFEGKIDNSQKVAINIMFLILRKWLK